MWENKLKKGLLSFGTDKKFESYIGEEDS